MGTVSEAPTIQRLLPRQTPSSSPTTSIHPPPSQIPLRRYGGLPTWGIMVIVIGGLLILSLCVLLALWLRGRRRRNKGASLSFTKEEPNGDTTNDPVHDPKGDVTGRRSSGPITSSDMLGEEPIKTRRRDSLLDQAEVRIRKLIKKTRPATSNSTSRLVRSTTNDDDQPPNTSFTTTTGGGSSTTKLRDATGPPTALSYGGGLDNSIPNDNANNLFRNFSFKSPLTGGRPHTGSSATSNPKPHPGTSPPIGSPSNHPLTGKQTGGGGGIDYYNSAYYNSVARPSEEDWGWADDSIAHTIRGSYDNQDHSRDIEEEDIATTTHAGTTLYHGHGGATSTEGALSDEPRSGMRAFLSGGRRDGFKDGSRSDNFDVIPLETRASPPSNFWNASRTSSSRWVPR